MSNYEVHHNGESQYKMPKAMEVYNVGPDELDFVQDGYKWIVVHYEQGSYEGSGEAIGFGEDEKLYKWHLGHCSCYGPWDGGPEEISLPNFVGENVICDESRYEEVNKKVRELLSQN